MLPVRQARKARCQARLWWIASHVFGYSILIQKGALSRNLNTIQQALLYFLVVSGNFVMYIALQRSSPGFATIEEEELNESALRRCSDCSIAQPLRSKHCRDCNRCVLLYDHHCACAGTCIGQSNRRIFVLYLSFQVAEAWWNSILAWDSFTKTTESHWLETNTTVLLVYLSLLFSLLLNVPLLLFQLYLISRNQSTWEFSRRNRISYLKSLPKGINPFDRGIFINCKAFWMHRFDDLNQKQRDIPEYLDSIVI